MTPHKKKKSKKDKKEKKKDKSKKKRKRDKGSGAVSRVVPMCFCTCFVCVAWCVELHRKARAFFMNGWDVWTQDL